MTPAAGPCSYGGRLLKRSILLLRNGVFDSYPIRQDHNWVIWQDFLFIKGFLGAVATGNSTVERYRVGQLFWLAGRQ